MPTKLTIEHLSCYLPYGVKMANGKFIGTLLSVYKSGVFNVSCSNWREQLADNKYKLILRPISDLAKPINYGMQTYAATELFEIGDDGGYNYEFDHGNVKLIRHLESMSKHNLYHDFNFMPFAVARELFEKKFDVFGLIPSGLAISIHEVEGDVYP